MWAKFKRAFTNKLFKTLDEVSVFIENQVLKLKTSETIKTCQFDYIFSQQFWTKY